MGESVGVRAALRTTRRLDVGDARAVRAGVAIAVAWALVQAVLFGRLGVRAGGDTGRYLDAANALLRGAWPAGKAGSYLGYDLFVAAFVGSGLGTGGVVAGQVALTALAAYCLYRLAARAYDHRAGVLAALLYVTCPVIHAWNFYVLTESVFVSTAIVATCLLVEARSPWRQAVALLAVLFASTVRPNGLVLLLGVATCALLSLWRARRYAVLGIVALGAALLAPGAATAVGGMLGQQGLVEEYLRGTIIWGYDDLRLSVPPAIQAARPGSNPIGQVLGMAVREPGYFLELAGLKLGYEYAQARPYYSTGHNAFLVATLLPTYALALWGVRRTPTVPAARVLPLAAVLFQSLAIALTFADWDGRHLLVILPFVFMFAAAGVWDLRDRVTVRWRPGRGRVVPAR
jgi:Dolichyl-phosphate-mannose-protein mannosyltransferase